jgi:hypothetical protein
MLSDRVWRRSSCRAAWRRRATSLNRLEKRSTAAAVAVSSAPTFSSRCAALASRRLLIAFSR